MAASASVPAVAAAKYSQCYQFKLSEHGGDDGPTEAEVAAATHQVVMLDTRKLHSLKVSIRHFLSRNPSEAIRNAQGALDYGRMLPLWLAHTTKHTETRKRLKAQF